MSHRILQWNCRGIKPNYNEILLMLNKHNPSCFCLQETFLKSNDQITFKNYSIYNHMFENPERACGGSSIIVDNKFPHRKLDLDVKFQAIAVVVRYIGQYVSALFIYLHHSNLIWKTYST